MDLCPLSEQAKTMCFIMWLNQTDCLKIVIYDNHKILDRTVICFLAALLASTLPHDGSQTFGNFCDDNVCGFTRVSNQSDTK